MIKVVMPQMGESIAEGTIIKWLKAAGDQVERDEPLFEITTDKVDTEVPSPASGVLKTILVAEGETVDVGATVAEVEVARTTVWDTPVMIPGGSLGAMASRMGTRTNPPPAPIRAPSDPAMKPRKGRRARCSNSGSS